MDREVIMDREFVKRREALSAALQKKGVDIALIMQNVDMYYYCGSIPSGVLLIDANATSILAVRRGFLRARDEARLEKENIVQIRGFSDLPRLMEERGMRHKRIGMEMDVVPADMFFRIKKLFSESEFLDISRDIRWQRSIKSDFEIGEIREAARMLDCTMEDAKEVLRAGKREIEVSAELEYRARKRGHQGRSRMRAFNGEMFMGHVHSGYRSAYPSGYQKPTAGIGPHPSYPEGASFEKIEENSPVIVDFLGNYHGYIADETRTFATGKLNEKLLSAYQFCRDVMEWFEENAKPGAIAGQLYDKCIEMAKRSGFSDNFMGIKGNQTSFIGHGVGLELDELPLIAVRQEYELKPGMVFAFEPKVSYKDLGSVGIENTYLVTENGLESLTRFPKEIVYI